MSVLDLCTCGHIRDEHTKRDWRHVLRLAVMTADRDAWRAMVRELVDATPSHQAADALWEGSSLAKALDKARAMLGET